MQSVNSRTSAKRGPRSPRWSRALLIIAFLIAVFLTYYFSGPVPSGVLDDDVIARVNDVEISTAQLQRVRVDLVELADLRAPPDVAQKKQTDDELDETALNELIRRELLLQEARRRGLSISTDEFDQALTTLRRRFADLSSFGEWMSRRGLDDQALIKSIQDDLLVRQVTSELLQDFNVSERQAAEYFAENGNSVVIGEQIRLRIIVVKEEIAADQILRALAAGESFENLAQQVSIGQRAMQGGDTGWLNLDSLAPNLKQAVDGLKPNEATGPVQKDDSEFMVVALAGRRPLQATTLEDARAEIDRRLLPSVRRNGIEAWFAAQAAVAEIELF